MNTETEQKMKNQMMRCGNSAHHLKNILSQLMDDQLPELIILSDEASRIEGLCQDIMRTNLNFRYLSYFEGWKVALRKIKRHIKISQRIILTREEDSYFIFSKETEELIMRHLKLQEELAGNLDSYLNKLFIQFTDGNGKSFEYTDSYTSELYDEMDFDSLNQKQINGDNINSLSHVLQIALEACNRAHNIQNYVCSYQVKHGYEGSANTIVGHSGEIENQFREIQKHLTMHNQNLVEMKNNIKNQANYARSKLEGIKENLKQIEKDCKFQQSKSIDSICQIIDNTCEFFACKLTDEMAISAA